MSAVIFMASLTQTAFVVDWSFSLDFVDPRDISGTVPLVFGWGGLFNAGNLGYAAWLANPGIAATWVLYLGDKKPVAQISAVISLVLTLSFLMVKEVPFLGPKQLDPVPIVSYGIGYWLWVASAAILASGTCADMYRSSICAKAGR